MDTAFKSNHLLLTELNYELRIRDTFTEKSCEDKRKILGRLLAKEKQQRFDPSLIVDKTFDFASDKCEIENTLTSIENLISDFEGPTTDSCFRRAISRLNHVTLRIKRISPDILNDTDLINKDYIIKFKNEAYASAVKLEADLYDRVKDVDTNTMLNNSFLNTTVHGAATCNPVVVTPPSKSVPVYKLGIQFDGNPKNLLSFIEKVEEVATARNVAKSELFQSASDLFTDKATYWFRQIKSTVKDWDSLVAKLKKDFLNSDFDDELWSQIKNRKQGRNEPIVIFIACMEALFSRLSHYPAESTKIKFIKLGLQSEYQKRLALSEIDTIEYLSKLCKKLEEADVLSLASTSSNSKVYSLESDLAYATDDNLSERRKNKYQSKNNFQFSKSKNNINTNFSPNNFSNQNQNSSLRYSKDKKNGKQEITKNCRKNKPILNAVEVKPAVQKTDSVICWSCGQLNHTFRNCLSVTKKKFCYKCGQQNVTVKECQRCTGNA